MPPGETADVRGPRSPGLRRAPASARAGRPGLRGPRQSWPKRHRRPSAVPPVDCVSANGLIRHDFWGRKGYCRLIADSPGTEAAQRAQELLRREAELTARKLVTKNDVKRAAQRAERAHQRDQEARNRELHRHYEAGAAHERAAEVHALAVEEGLGDVADHRRAAEREREAARRNLLAAQEADRQDA